MKLRLGLIGLGNHWETRYLPALRALSDRFQIQAVCDQVGHRASTAAALFGATPLDGFRALVGREDVDAVLVLGRQWYGALPILAASEAGKAVYYAGAWDFPPDVVDRLRREIDHSGVAFMADYILRYQPATLRLKELIATRLGPPRLMFCHGRFPEDRSRHCAPHSLPGDPNMHNLVELVDWCAYVVGRQPTSIVGLAHWADESLCRADYEMMHVDFTPPDHPLCSDVVAHISCSRYFPPNWPEAVTFRPPAPLQILCERGIAFVDLPSYVAWFDEAGRHVESLESERPEAERQLAQFHRQVTSLVRGTAVIDDAFRAVSIVLRARASQRDQRRLSLAE